MTDARIPERYLVDRRIVRLSHIQRSSYFMATLWSVSNRTDGHIDKGDIPLIPTFDQEAIGALVGVGLWAPTSTGWLDTEFETVQTSRDELTRMDNMRRADREKKARQRAHAKGDHAMCLPEGCDQIERPRPAFAPAPTEDPQGQSRGQSRGHVPGTQQERTGEERRGQDKEITTPKEVAPCCGQPHGPLEMCDTAERFAS